MLVDRIKPADLQNLQAKRKDEGLADSAVDQETAAAKVMVNRAFDNDLISDEPHYIIQLISLIQNAPLPFIAISFRRFRLCYSIMFTCFSSSH
jgi:hypothetical protein